MDYIAAISGAIIGAIIFILRDIQKSKKILYLLMLPRIFLKTKGKQL
jgi:maltodextrin utilization protein YvdJ